LNKKKKKSKVCKKRNLGGYDRKKAPTGQKNEEEKENGGTGYAGASGKLPRDKGGASVKPKKRIKKGKKREKGGGNRKPEKKT